MDPLTVMTALLPIAQDGIRAVINRFTGGAGAQPANAEEAIRLIESETKRLEAIARIDTPTGQVSEWVNNVRALQRPVAAAMILIAYWFTLVGIVGVEIQVTVANLTSSVVFYLFGDRTVMYMRGKGNAAP